MDTGIVPPGASPVDHYSRFGYNRGMREAITSPSNPLVKLARSLRQHKSRKESGLFLAEGIAPVGQAAEAGWEIEALLFAPDLLTSDFARQLVAGQELKGVRCAALTPGLLAGLAEKENPQGLLAIVRQRHLGLEMLDPASMRWGAAAVAPQDPGNVGTILRTLDAVGADGLFLLDGGVELYHPSVVRASMGALFWKPVVQASFDDFIAWARAHAVRLVGSSAHARIDYRSLVRDDRATVLVLGSEQKGLSAEQLAACEAVVSLPMRGRVSSLNLAVAAGVMLYAMLQEKD
jgi:RNA methyltransferase, TrmH family